MGFINGNLPRVLGTAALSAGLLAAGGCDENSPIGNLAEQCGLTCDTNFVAADGSLTGQVDVTGTPSIDGFFQATVDFVRVGGEVNRGIRAQLTGMKADFGLDADADFKAEFEAMASTYLDGGISVDIQEPVCKVDAQASIDAAAKCDVDVDPGSVEVKCEGGCEAEVSASVMCDASAEVKCTFQGPSLSCSGSCQGSCTVEAPQADCNGSCSGTCEGSCVVDLSAGGSCEGTCNGTCEGSTMNGGQCNGTCKGECELTGNAAASCTGKCEGGCTGSCTFDPGGASCSGSCNGSCEATAPDGNCEGAVEAKCEAMADASIQCDASCDGNVEPPKVKAECEAQVEAQASLEVECEPPSVAIDYQLKGGVDLEADAKAAAFIEGLGKLRARLPKLRVSFERANRLAPAAEGVATAAIDAVASLPDVIADGDVDFATKTKLRCAIEKDDDGMTPLNVAANQLKDTGDELGMNASETKDAFAAFGVGL